MITAAMLQVVEQAGEAVLVLIDGVVEDEFKRSRLTRHEVRRQLLLIAGTLAGLPDVLHGSMPEIDWDGWAQIGRSLVLPADAADDTAWFASRSAVPALLSWLRVYRRAEPALFAFNAL